MHSPRHGHCAGRVVLYREEGGAQDGSDAVESVCARDACPWWGFELGRQTCCFPDVELQQRLPSARENPAVPPRMRNRHLRVPRLLLQTAARLTWPGGCTDCAKAA